ncbi:MAG: hypothetical protein ABW004_03695 [Aeromicrobium sp.]
MRIGPLLAVVLLAGTATACGGGKDDEIETTPLPDGIVMHVDQSRVERKGREVFLRVENNTTEPVTVTAFELTSPRLEDVAWTGDDEIGATYETDLEFNLPTGRCGTDIDAEVVLTYRMGDGELRRSKGPADDPYGAAALFADRDCAQTTLTDAADITVGQPQVSGEGRGSVLRLPVTLTPTGDADDVRFGGFESTVLFKQATGSPADVDIPLRAGEKPVELVMAVVPARCDPHALAEDKVGTLFGVKVRAPGLDDDASFFLPLEKAQRSAFFAFFRSYCGLP